MKNKNNQFRTIIINITPPQRRLIEAMNEFRREKFDFNCKNRKDASEYIYRNMNEFMLATMENWQFQYESDDFCSYAERKDEE